MNTGKRGRFEADHLPLIAEVKNVWSHVSTSSTICMTRCSISHTGIITFRFFYFKSVWKWLVHQVVSTPSTAINYMRFLPYIPAVLSNLEEGWFPYLPFFVCLWLFEWRNVHSLSCGTQSFFFLQQPPVGQGLLIHEFSRSHKTTHHSWYNSSGRVISPT